MVDKHDLPLKSLKAIRGLNEDTIEVRPEPFTYSVNLRDMGAAHPDHFWCYPPRSAVVAYHAAALDQAPNCSDHASGELIVDLAHNRRRQLHLRNACARCGYIESRIERRQASR